jgi:hypothetical protein
MNPTWAEDNLRTIRTLMENSAVYRRALAPILIALGITGSIAAIVAGILRLPPEPFCWFWSAVALLALGLAFLLARRAALKDSEPFWTAPVKRVAQALAAPLVAGTILTAFAGDDAMLAVGIWLLLYGCALRAASFFTIRCVGTLGWLFVLAGAAFLAIAFRTGFSWDSNVASLAMGVCFGGFHLAFGLYLHFTKTS